MDCLGVEPFLTLPWIWSVTTRVHRIRLKKLFASKRIDANLDLIRLIFACFLFFAYLIYPLHSLTNIRFNSLRNMHLDNTVAHCLLPTVYGPLFTAHCLLLPVY
jgi:hypothetical protein